MTKKSPLGGKSVERDVKSIRVLANLAPVTPTTPTDHGTLTGLADDDHSHYVHNSSGRTITAQHSFAPSSTQAPFSLGANAQGQLVTGLRADELNKSIGAGAGLSGGGLLTANRDLAVDLTYAFTWAALHTFNAGIRIASGQSVQFATDAAISRKAADTIQIASGDALESNSYAAGVYGWRLTAAGDFECENAYIRGELSASVFRIKEIHATAGTMGVFYSASVVYEDFTVPSAVGNAVANVQIKNSPDGLPLLGSSAGYRIRIKAWDGAGIRDSWFEVTAVGSNMGEYTLYTFTLRSGSTSWTCRAGTAVVAYGTATGGGVITLSADGAVGAVANMSIQTNAGSPWSSQTLQVRLGNMNGSYGAGANDRYGIGIGDYTGGNYLSYNAESAGDFIIKAGDGYVLIGENGIDITAANSALATLKWNGSTGQYLEILGYNSDIYTGNILVNDGETLTKATMHMQVYSYGGGYSAILDLVSGSNKSRVYGYQFEIESFGAEALISNTPGLIVNQAGNDGYILTLKSSDIAHGMTDVLETDSYGVFRKASATLGGLYMGGFGESTSETGMLLVGVAGTADTTHSSAGVGVTRIYSAIKDGTTTQAVAANGNLLTVENRGATRLIVDAEGDLFIDGSQSSYDDYDDVGLIRGFEQAMSQRGEALDRAFRGWLEARRADLVEIGIMQPEEGNYFYNVTRLQRLQNGALWQLHERLEKLERRLLDA